MGRTKENMEKEKPLIFAIAVALKVLGIKYDCLAHKHNFKSRLGFHVPDFLLSNGKIEAKNWNCIKYWVNISKCFCQIVARFIDINYSEAFKSPKILVISKPIWREHSLEYLRAHGIIIIELRYFVTWDNVDQAISDLEKSFSDIGLESSIIECKEESATAQYTYAPHYYNLLRSLLFIHSPNYRNSLNDVEMEIYNKEIGNHG